ncbi:hypothetical protein F5Y19DRAFT_487033 [Xylariaceae sp. FL1651]|nr:hypothetical protein F5Y19DRAFT_487033 [Xylariaceae sp. FL1651]
MATDNVIETFFAVAFYNVVELTFIIFVSFKRWSGLYFRSFLVSSRGIAFYGVGFLIRDLELSKNSILYVTLIVISWCAMVTVLDMIIVNAIICRIPINVLIYGTNSSNSATFTESYSIYEKAQVTIFFIQESIISALYIASTALLLKLKSMLHGGSNHQIMKHLIYVNVIIVLLDITILGLEYSGLYLKFEFSILKKLVDLAQTRQANSSARSAATDTIPLDTFDDDRPQKRMTCTKRTGNYSCKAFASRGAGDHLPKDNTSVLIHTEMLQVHLAKITSSEER